MSIPSIFLEIQPQVASRTLRFKRSAPNGKERVNRIESCLLISIEITMKATELIVNPFLRVLGCESLFSESSQN